MFFKCHCHSTIRIQYNRLRERIFNLKGCYGFYLKKCDPKFDAKSYFGQADAIQKVFWIQIFSYLKELNFSGKKYFIAIFENSDADEKKIISSFSV